MLALDARPIDRRLEHITEAQMKTASSGEALLSLALRLRLGVVTIARSHTYCGQHFQGERGPAFRRLA